MTHPGFQGASMRALRVLEAGSSGFLKPPHSLHARESLRSARAPRASLSFVEGRFEANIHNSNLHNQREHDADPRHCLGRGQRWTPRPAQPHLIPRWRPVSPEHQEDTRVEAVRAHDSEQGEPCADWTTPRTGRKVAI